MKNKKAFKIGLLSTVVVGMAIAVTAISMNHGKLFMGRGVLHDASCQWNHYDEVAATYESHGSKEFWACCTHPGEAVLEQPTEGTITDMGPLVGEYFDSLTSEDPRFIPELEGGNKYAQLDVIGWQDPALLYSVNEYSDIQSVTLKLRVVGEFNSWFAIGVHSTHSDWEGLNFFTTGLDGEWHLVTVNLNASGYVNFCYNLDHVQEGHIDIDDITIVTASGVYFEDFESNTLMALDADHARIAQVAPGNKFLREDSLHIEDELVTVYTAKQYTDVTNISYKVRVPEGCGNWGGVAVASDLSIYNNTNPKYPADGTWHTVSQDFGGVTGYVEFCHEQGHFTGPLDIDDVVITYDGGKLAYEGFDGPSIFRTRKAELATIQTGEPSKAIGVVALDASVTSVENREYTPLFTASKGIDAEYGSYVQLDDWQCRSNQDRCWIGFTQTESLSLVKARLGAEIESLYLFIYNPLETSFSMQIMLDHHYSNVATASLAPKAWTRVNMPVGTYGSYTLTEAHQIGFDHPFGAGNEGAVVGSGWKFTSFYAKAHETVDCFARLNSSTYSSGTASLYTIDSLTNITNVTYDYRLTGGALEGKGAWTGFGVAANHDIYTGMHTISGADKWDGEWHTRSVDLSSESGYVNIIHACGEQVEGSTFDIDNIVITLSDGTTITEDFSDGVYHTFMYYPSHPERVELIPQ